ncbi:MAG: TonB family protein [Pseudomonadota bacterium]
MFRASAGLAAWALLAFGAAAQTVPAVDGRAEISCTVQADGRLADCRVLSETPEGQGFGEEALRAAAQAQLTPETRRRTRQGARVNFPVTFRLASDEEAVVSQGDAPARQGQEATPPRPDRR